MGKTHARTDRAHADLADAMFRWPGPDRRVGSALTSTASDLLTANARAPVQGRQGRDFGHVPIHADQRVGGITDAAGAQARIAASRSVDELGRSSIEREIARRFGAVGALPGRLEAAATGAAIGGVGGAIVGALIGGGAGALIGGGLGAAIGGAAGAALGSIFPSYAQIVGDAAVSTAITTAWANTEAAATATTRREEGFWIRLNTANNSYEFTSTVLGPSIGPGQTGSVQLGARPADTSAGTPTAVYTVASFHTHTPTAFRTVGRPVGPSGADHATDTSDDVVGVVFDYVASPAGTGNIPAAHPIGSAAQAYHSGPNRRQRA